MGWNDFELYRMAQTAKQTLALQSVSIEHYEALHDALLNTMRLVMFVEFTNHNMTVTIDMIHAVALRCQSKTKKKHPSKFIEFTTKRSMFAKPIQN